MDAKISKYFCIFCEKCTDFETIGEAYDHYKQHMKVNYYCVDCDNDRQCNADHSRSPPEADASDGSGDESGLIEMWTERFLSYQSEWIDKSYSQLFQSTKLFTECVVCQTFLKLCTHNGIEHRKGDLQWSLNEAPNNEMRHICSHLRYYPFECHKCESDGRYLKKCDFAEITRHIRNSHSQLLSLKDTSLESLIKSVKISKLESFINYCIRNRKSTPAPAPVAATPARPKPPVLLAPRTPKPAVQLTPTRISKRLLSQPRKPVIVPKPEPTVTRPKKARTYSQTSIVSNGNENHNILKSNEVKITPIINDKNLANNSINKSLSFTQNKMINNNNNRRVNKFVVKSAPKVELKFKPIVRTYSNQTNMSLKAKQNLISGDQIIIKSVSEESKKGISIINKLPHNMIIKPITPVMNNSTVSQQFSDMMDTEDNDCLQIDLNSMNFPEMTDVQYFCIFCTETMATKDLAYEHMQTHLDYFPIICLTCGEGLINLQSFLKHHRESHPEALKGRYKKKEQPAIEKWISSYLYSQTTIIRSFPPRETCPVCDRVFSRPEVLGQKPRRCTINRKIDHLYRHLSYLPYECILCKQSGNEFYVAYFESKAHSHIKLKHPEIDDNEERWQVFQKTITIPKLDEFIDNYLSQFGISTQFERRPVKKAIKYSSPTDTTTAKTTTVATNDNNTLDFNNSSLNLNMIFSDIIDTTEAPVLDLNVNDIKCNNEMNITINNNAINDNIIDDDMSNGVDIKPDVEMSLIDINKDEFNLNEVNDIIVSNDNTMIVDVSPLNIYDKTIADDCDKEMFYCIFCPQLKYLSKMDAYSHYGEHLEYFPITCKLCLKCFSDVDLMMAHHKADHSAQDTLDFDMKEDQSIVKWVNEFLDSQLAVRKVMPCSCGSCCPVCIKMVSSESFENLNPCVKHNDVLFSVHIHKHLHYYPYECVTCKRNGQLVRVPNLDSIAMSHMKQHNVNNASMSQVVKNFPKTLVIPVLEKLIGDCVHRKRMSEKRCQLQPSVTKANTLSLIDLNGEQPSTSAPIYTNLLQKKTQHTRLEGGRIVNLPPKPPSIASLNHSNDSAAINGTTGQPNNFRCIHCSKYFPNKKSFKVHHNQTHPGKPILCTRNV